MEREAALTRKIEDATGEAAAKIKLVEQEAEAKIKENVSGLGATVYFGLYTNFMVSRMWASGFFSRYVSQAVFFVFEFTWALYTNAAVASVICQSPSVQVQDIIGQVSDTISVPLGKLSHEL